ncbi:MAG: 23S rRNA (uracil(1939)-C(5))-methyltransferase RlmD [Alphaproteobacteria bacterium CG_4_9_14_3_um_filter_47_13]|nr:MAG: 23S rRNA (uracil(1939)-C(5))-methyltransferase RlmD [Alphaproteobacteria bacterium CG_4_9_14_3_um_filter_47_13]
MNTEFDIKIERLGLKGDGIGTLEDGRRVFVSGVLSGEKVHVRFVSEKPEGAMAKLVRILEPSLQRIEAPCLYFGQCGGCALQHMNVQSYRDFKTERVKQALLGAGIKREVDELFVSPSYRRRRAVLSAKCTEKGSVQIGFNERASHTLVEIDSCFVLRPALMAVVPYLRLFLPRLMTQGECYDVAIAESEGLVEMLIIVLGKQEKKLRKEDKAILYELSVASAVARLSWQASERKAAEVLFKQEDYVVRLGSFSVQPPPGGFLQATEEGQEALTSFAVAGLSRKSRVADLYAGCGTFTFSLLDQGHRVDSFEGNKAALDSLTQAGKGDSRVQSYQRDLVKEPLTFQELKIYDAVVIDPPRVGALRQMEEIGRSSVSKVISISCNPDSFARDAKILVQNGFILKRLKVVDQFLWSPHVEVAGLFVRRR